MIAAQADDKNVILLSQKPRGIEVGSSNIVSVVHDVTKDPNSFYHSTPLSSTFCFACLTPHDGKMAPALFLHTPTSKSRRWFSPYVP